MARFGSTFNPLLGFVALSLVSAGLPLASAHAETVKCTAITTLPTP